MGDEEPVPQQPSSDSPEQDADTQAEPDTGTQAEPDTGTQAEPGASQGDGEFKPEADPPIYKP